MADEFFFPMRTYPRRYSAPKTSTKHFLTTKPTHAPPTPPATDPKFKKKFIKLSYFFPISIRYTTDIPSHTPSHS